LPASFLLNRRFETNQAEKRDSVKEQPLDRKSNKNNLLVNKNGKSRAAQSNNQPAEAVCNASYLCMKHNAGQ
jgi:chromatin remodeling complex protein RSC6